MVQRHPERGRHAELFAELVASYCETISSELVRPNISCLHPTIVNRTLYRFSNLVSLEVCKNDYDIFLFKKNKRHIKIIHETLISMNIKLNNYV